jgi:hypothetical protein
VDNFPDPVDDVWTAQRQTAQKQQVNDLGRDPRVTRVRGRDKAPFISYMKGA